MEFTKIMKRAQYKFKLLVLFNVFLVDKCRWTDDHSFKNITITNMLVILVFSLVCCICSLHPVIISPCKTFLSGQ